MSLTDKVIERIMTLGTINWPKEIELCTTEQLMRLIYNEVIDNFPSIKNVQGILNPKNDYPVSKSDSNRQADIIAANLLISLRLFERLNYAISGLFIFRAAELLQTYGNQRSQSLAKVLSILAIGVSFLDFPMEPLNLLNSLTDLKISISTDYRYQEWENLINFAIEVLYFSAALRGETFSADSTQCKLCEAVILLTGGLIDQAANLINDINPQDIPPDLKPSANTINLIIAAYKTNTQNKKESKPTITNMIMFPPNGIENTGGYMN